MLKGIDYWCVLLIVVSLMYVWRWRGRRRINLPPGPRRWPVIGNLLQIGPVPHLGMQRMNREYGPLVYLHIGMVPAVVTDSPKYVKELLVKQDHLFASRPKSIASEHFTFGGNDIAFAPMGAHWREVRRLCCSELLSAKKVDSFRQGRHEEAQCMVADVARACEQGHGPINMRDLFGSLTNNSITRMLLGQRFFGARGADIHLAAQHKGEIYDAFSLIDAFNVADYLPFLRPFDLQGHEKRMGEIMVWVNDLYDRVIAEQQRSLPDCGSGPINFVHTMLQAQQRGDNNLNLTKIKAILIDMVAAGTDTSSITSEWTMAELMRHPEYMEKVQQEIEEVVGRERMVEESDLGKLRMLRAVVKEVLRMHPVGGFLIPHLCMADTKVEGYDIPKGTRILINTYALGRNPAVWEDPDTFRPERFLSAEADNVVEIINDPNCRTAPFGAGRRKCPGAELGMNVVLLGLSRLAHLFNWCPPDPRKERLDEEDMAEAKGYTIKGRPLFASPTPRLPQLLSLITSA